MLLNDEEKRMLGGEQGPGIQKAMDLLVQLGETFDAERLVPISYAHFNYDPCPEDFWNLLTEEVSATPHRVTTHPSFQPGIWKKWGLPLADLLIDEHERKVKKLKRLGWLRTETCAEYLIGIIPRKGDIVAMSGGCMQVANNSLFGARVERLGNFISLAPAVSGRIPLMGLLLPENRLAKHIVELDDLDVTDWTASHYHCLGYYIGDQLREFDPVAVNGLPPNLLFDFVRSLLSSMPALGALTLGHIVGTTPEAPTLEAALGNRKPDQVIKVGKSEMKKVWESLNIWNDDVVEHVALGCPHANIDKIGRIAARLEGKTIKTSMLIGASGPVEALARKQGYADIIEQAGGRISCVCPTIRNPFTLHGVAGEKQAKSAATDSARGAHSLANISKVKVFFGTEEECINAAITGRWRGETPKWK